MIGKNLWTPEDQQDPCFTALLSIRVLESDPHLSEFLDPDPDVKIALKFWRIVYRYIFLQKCPFWLFAHEKDYYIPQFNPIEENLTFLCAR